MGTYSLEVSDTVSQNVGFKQPDCGGTNLLLGVNTGPGTLNNSVRNCDGVTSTPLSGNARFTFSLVAPAIRLDGGSLIAYAGLPFGWIATSALLSVSFNEGQFNGDFYLQYSSVIERKFAAP